MVTKNWKSVITISALVVVLTAGFGASTALSGTIDMVTVGDPGNTADSNGYGAVAYTYRMGKYEVTNAQFCEFLNTVDPTGTNTLALYVGGDARYGINQVLTNPVGSRYVLKDPLFGNKPIGRENFYSEARFCNWLQNGQGSGSTETGAYDTTTWTRQPGATFFVPNRDEWYKAAYYKGGGTNAGYWLYTTQSNTAPTNATANTANGDVSNPGPNVANYGNVFSWTCPAGTTAFSSVGTCGAPSAYGTYDQGGDVLEWTEQLTGSQRTARGGSYKAGTPASSYSFNLNQWSTVNYDFGFRVAGLLLNAPPNAASTGGPYTLFENMDLVLSGSGSDPDNDLLVFLWKLNGHDLPFTTAGGTVPWGDLLPMYGMVPGTPYALELTVRDPSGETFQAQPSTVTIEVPEPATMILLATGLLGLLRQARRRLGA